MQRIESLSWGEIIVKTDNKIKTFKDLMIWPGGCCEWDWKKDGTKHSSGITLEAVKTLYDKGSQYIILSKGVHNKLKLSKKALEFLNDMRRIFGIPYVFLNSIYCWNVYNAQSTKYKVGMLLHSTC